MAQKHYIDGGVKRMMVVDNADALEALNPRVRDQIGNRVSISPVPEGGFGSRPA
ncbi:hypothetical protein GFY24_13500 [Nocardia sp. SYP-A9097]|uniref:hypothetical protein n=1 Tax=Nocardia sp. SYP-A9097 TaxID=2663237 RepID=UPI00129B49C3|nr:hypothetical protein [Nocardia sp. SYP-A9097]MRH88448.1 hypothetical protein [Nocardia sp. SYP-A9097]